MKIRAKFIVSIIGVMFVTFLIVLLCILLTRAGSLLSQQKISNQRTARLMENMLSQRVVFNKTNKVNDCNKQVCKLATVLANSRVLVGEWSIIDDNKKIIINSSGITKKTDCSLRSIDNHFIVGNNRYILSVKINKESLFVKIIEGMDTIIIGMFAGIFFLACVVYLLTSRLVLEPVLKVLAMTRILKYGGNLGHTHLTKRKDEVGELVNSFVDMSKEVSDNRVNLQKKIDEKIKEIANKQKTIAFQDRLAATGKLASGVAHEINNPLAGVINAVDRLRKGNVEDCRKEEYFELIMDGLQRIKDIVASILVFARKEPIVEEVDIREPIQGAIDFCRHRFEKNKITLTEDWDNINVKIMADSKELQQVFLNLLVNAIDAVDENIEEKKITISSSIEDCKVVVSISDNGIGMDDEQIQKSFELFHTTKPVGKGTGLGISISNDIINRINGELLLESKKNEGTIAYVRLPLVKQDVI